MTIPGANSPEGLGFIAAMSGLPTWAVLLMAARSRAFAARKDYPLEPGSQGWHWARFYFVEGDPGEQFGPLATHTFLYFEAVVDIRDDDDRDVVIGLLEEWYDKQVGGDRVAANSKGGCA